MISNAQPPRYRDLRIYLPGASEKAKAKLIFPNGDERHFKFVAPCTPGETARALMTARESLEFQGARGISAYDSPDPLRDLGTRLFSAVFGDFYSEYRATVQDTVRHGYKLRIQIVTKDLAIGSLPWEFLYDISEADFAALHPDRTVLRQWDEDPNKEGLNAVEPPLRVLAIALGTNSGIIEAELAIVHKSVLKSGEEYHKRLELDVVRLGPDTGPERIEEMMSSGDYQMIHLVADPKDAYSYTYPSTESKGSRDMTSVMEKLFSTESSLRVMYCSGVDTRWLAGFKGNPKVVNPSFVSLGDISGSVRLPIPTHLLMGDRARLTFTRAFYEAICAGAPLYVAVSEGRHAIDRAMPGSREWGIPVLYLQAQDEPLLANEAYGHEDIGSALPSPPSYGGPSGGPSGLMDLMDELHQHIEKSQ